MRGSALDLSGSGLIKVAVFCENGNKALGCKGLGEFHN
jgi:hypothetical protein